MKGNRRHRGKKMWIGIKTKLIVAFMIPVLLIVILGAASYTKARKSMINNYEMTSQTSLGLMHKYFDVGFEAALAKATQLNANQAAKMYLSGYYKKDSVEESNKRTEVSEYINNMMLVTDMIQNIGVISPNVKGVWNGESISSDFYDEFLTAKEGIMLQETKEKNVWLGSHPYIDQETGGNDTDYCISLLKKFVDINYKEVGYIVVDIKESFIKDTLKEANLGENSILAFITSDGKEVFNQEVEEGFTFQSQDFYKAVQEDEQENGCKYVSYQGKKYLFLYEKIAEQNAIVCALVEEGILLKQVEGVKIATIVITVIASLIAAIIGLVLASNIEKKIYQANKALDQVAKGNLNQNLEYKSRDEFNVLGKGIFNMISSMKKMIQAMKLVSNAILNSTVDISRDSENLLEATSQIAITTSGIKEGVAQQAEDSQNCLIQMSQLADKVNEVCDYSNQVQETAHIAKESVESGLDSIEILHEKAKCTAEITAAVGADIHILEEKSKAIGNIVVAIEEIAGKTNLLALNASIESARAGEAGRGFSVVAGEIRELATQSKQAANKIAEIIGEIQKETEKTVRATQKAGSIVESQEEALRHTINSFNSIDKQVANLLSGLGEISEAVTDIEQSKNQTLVMIQNISATLEETAAATEDLDQTANRQIVTVKELNQTLDGLKEEAKELDREVLVFSL